MKNQFVYTRKELVAGTPENPEFKEFTDSLNVEKVIRTITTDDDRLLVLMDDLHERLVDAPNLNSRGKVNGIKKERNTFQSEIYLVGEDVKRFLKLTSVG